MTKQYLGEALPKRPEQQTRQLTNNGGFVSSLDGVSVDVRTIQSGGSYSMPTLEGVEFDRMRRYGLVLNRWAMSDIRRRSKRKGLSESACIAASRAVANHMFRHVFKGEDPSLNTVNVTPYINAIKSGSVTTELLNAVYALHGTGAFSSIVDALPTTGLAGIVRKSLEETSDVLSSYYLGSKASNWQYLNDIHSESKYKIRRGYDIYESIASTIEHWAKHTSDNVAQRKSEKQERAKGKGKKGQDKPQPGGRKVNGIPNKSVIPLTDDSGGWQMPFLAKYPLELPHTGKLGRREIATNEGRQPKAFYRLVTDPYRRIFKRKTRSLGGVVVFDCSGSMGLTQDDIHRVLSASAGCSILCYSASGDEDWDRKHGNIHLVAKNGRQMRGLPDFPGGNGVDFYALHYGYEHLRRNSQSPVIWVSDGQVTGKGDESNARLRAEVNHYTTRNKIIRVDTPNDAIRLLSRLQRKVMS